MKSTNQVSIKNLHESHGLDWMFDVLFHEVMEKHPLSRESFCHRLIRLYEGYTPSQCQALDEVFRELFHRSFSEIFSMPTH